jgi:hypothetical protein
MLVDQLPPEESCYLLTVAIQIRSCKLDEWTLVPTTMQCAMLGGAGRTWNAGDDQGNADDVGRR